MPTNALITDEVTTGSFLTVTAEVYKDGPQSDSGTVRVIDPDPGEEGWLGGNDTLTNSWGTLTWTVSGATATWTFTLDPDSVELAALGDGENFLVILSFIKSTLDALFPAEVSIRARVFGSVEGGGGEPTPTTCYLSISLIKEEFKQGFNLDSYRGTPYYDENGNPGTFPTEAISISDFCSKRLTATGPVVGDNAVTTSRTFGYDPVFQFLAWDEARFRVDPVFRKLSYGEPIELNGMTVTSITVQKRFKRIQVVSTGGTIGTDFELLVNGQPADDWINAEGFSWTTGQLSVTMKDIR